MSTKKKISKIPIAPQIYSEAFKRQVVSEFERGLFTKSEIHEGLKIFKTDTKGFWTTSVEVAEYERVLLKFKMDWKGNIIMTSFLNGEKHFIIKKEKWYSNILVMKDENEKVYFHLKRNYKWKDFKYHYEIALEEDLDELTLLSIIHVVNYFSSQDDGSAATTAATV